MSYKGVLLAVADRVRDTTELPYHVELASLDDLFVDGDFQRALTSFWKKIYETWDPAQLNVLITNRRVNSKGKPLDKLSVIDGQTRLRAYEERIKNDLPTPPLACLVFEGMTKEEESRLFSKLTRNRRGMRSYDRFRSDIVGNHPIALAVAKAATDAGYELSADETPKTLRAIGALEAVYKRGKRLDKIDFDGEMIQLHEADILHETMQITRAAWPDEQQPTGEIIRGLGMLLARNQKNPLDSERLARRLGRETMERLSRRANATREGAGGGANSPKYMANVMETEYVRGR
jgi:hypothetical protein